MIVPNLISQRILPSQGGSNKNCRRVDLPPDTPLTPVDDFQGTKQYLERTRVGSEKICNEKGRNCKWFPIFEQLLSCQYRAPDGRVLTGVSRHRNVAGRYEGMNTNVCPGYLLVKTRGVPGTIGGASEIETYYPQVVEARAGQFEALLDCGQGERP